MDEQEDTIMQKLSLGFGMMCLPVEENDPNKVEFEEACQMDDIFL